MVYVGPLLGSFIFFLNVLDMIWMNVNYTKMNTEKDSLYFGGENQ